jgi:hypothetical protein
MASIFREKIAREKIDILAAGVTRQGFNPEKVLDGRLRHMALHAACRIEGPYRL